MAFKTSQRRVFFVAALCAGMALSFGLLAAVTYGAANDQTTPTLEQTVAEHLDGIESQSEQSNSDSDAQFLPSPAQPLPVVVDGITTEGVVPDLSLAGQAVVDNLEADPSLLTDPDDPWYIRESLLNSPQVRAITDRYEAPGMSSPPGWDPGEFATLRSRAGQRPFGDLGLPMTEREFIQTDPVADAVRRNDAGAPFFGTGPEADPGITVPLADDGLLLSSGDFLDYDQDRATVYGHGHMVARLGSIRFSADRMLYNTRQRRLEAYGNVRVEGPGQSLQAQSLVLDTETFEGVAFEARGQSEGIYFLANPWKQEGAEIRFLNRQESALKDAAFTTCDFPVPHWRLQAKEILIRPGDRLFARNAVLYVHEVPVLWLPFANQNLGRPFPWFLSVGRTGRSGYYVRTGYRYEYEVTAPDAEENSTKLTSFRTALMADYFEKRGLGYGTEGRYSFGSGEAQGRFFVYQLQDESDDRRRLGSDDRTALRWLHKARLTPHLRVLLNADWVSDPEVYFDVLDQLTDGDARRQRRFERTFMAAAEYAKQDLYAGIQVRLGDRISRNRFTNPSDPRDDDQEFDRRFNEERFYTMTAPGRGPDGVFRSQPGRYTDNRSIPRTLRPGLPGNRFRRITEKAPHISIATNRQQIPGWPLYLETKFDAFRALDAGFNAFDPDDNTMVQGFHFRQNLTHQLRLTDRTTWINRFGYGFGMAERQDDGIVDFDLPDSAFPFLLNGSPSRPFTLLDRNTFLVGTRKRSFSSVRPEFAHGDYESILTSRLTDALSAFVKLRMREVNQDSLGEFYRSIGDIRSQDAIYAFPTNDRFLEAGATYQVLSPRLTLNARMGQNLQEQSRMRPNEIGRYLNLNANWRDSSGVFSVTPGMNLQQRQFLDPSDPSSFTENSRTLFATASYNPIHQRRYASVSAFLIRNEESVGDARVRDRDPFNSKSNSVISARMGQKIGTKYLLEYEGLIRTETQTPSENIFRLSRDFHDLIASVAVGVKERELSRDQEGTRDGDEINIRFDVEFKPASQRGVRRVSRETNLFSSRQAAEASR